MYLTLLRGAYNRLLPFLKFLCSSLFTITSRKKISNLHGRTRKNNYHFGIYENINLGLINYTLLGLIEHYGVFIDSVCLNLVTCVFLFN